jgi:hypothetical protein
VVAPGTAINQEEYIVLRKLFAAAAVLGLVAVVIPQSASAAPGDNNGVVVFVGDAKVGSNLTWNRLDSSSRGQGLCFPGHDPADNCALDPEVEVPVNAWKFNIPGAPVVTPAGNLPSSCNAVGRFAGLNAVPSGVPGNCAISSDGDVFANAIGVGPSCGMSGGHSESTEDVDEDGIADDDDGLDNRNSPATVTGNGPDTFSITGIGGGGITSTWITSAGGTIPLTGTLTVNGNTVSYAGVVQARPIGGAGQVPCLTEPATTFTVVGVTAGAAA